MTISDRTIFIGHASADAELADLVKDTLVNGEISNRQIFYSSDRSTGIPSGVGVREHLLSTLKECAVVIELVSDSFMQRPYCLIELGAAWAAEKPTIPVVIPPLTRDEVVRKIGDVQLDMLGTEEDIESFFNEVNRVATEKCGVSLSPHDWTRAVRTFKTRYPPIIARIAEPSASDPNPPATSPATPSTQVDDPAGGSAENIIKAEKGGVMIDGSHVLQGQFSTEVHGNITNSTPVSKTAVMKAYFFSSDSTVIGTADGLVAGLEGGSQQNYTLTSQNQIKEFSFFRVQIDAVF